MALSHFHLAAVITIILVRFNMDPEESQRAMKEF